MSMGAGKRIPPRQTIFGLSGLVCVFLLEQEIQIEDAWKCVYVHLTRRLFCWCGFPGLLDFRAATIHQQLDSISISDTPIPIFSIRFIFKPSFIIY
ncbi:hypothetical protein DPMN_039192 [Dreissena polymorpha]|uniref:Uncharacterized protein n=1 Tax=Dreissena polymorpha TaxID=45954 RepID=A0A9D4RRE4_DREPO|nr:hypothetical protein DPMN_039192 [Dreissena polymorpha]